MFPHVVGLQLHHEGLHLSSAPFQCTSQLDALRPHTGCPRVRSSQQTPPACVSGLVADVAATGLPAGEILTQMDSGKIRNKLLKDANERKRTWNSYMIMLVDDRLVPRWKDSTIDSQGFLEAVVRSARDEMNEKDAAKAGK